jgi:hypothetical protein
MALRPVIAICGTTGVGKSKLAIELALKLSERSDRHGWKGGVVVNADAMQTYKGFNSITNKIPLGERAGVDHVLMDFKEPTEQYVVGQWIHDATRAVSSSLSHHIAGQLLSSDRLRIRSAMHTGRKRFPSSSVEPHTGSSISFFPVDLRSNRSKPLARARRHHQLRASLPRMDSHLRCRKSQPICVSCSMHSPKPHHQRSTTLPPLSPCTTF